MTRIITQRELRDNFAAILREVHAGQTIVVSRNRVPVAELRPLASRRFAHRAVIEEAAQSAPRIDAARFRADLDAFADQSMDD